MKRQVELDKAQQALDEAVVQAAEVKQQRRHVDQEMRFLRLFFAEDNLAARWRKALMGEK